jgi:hypothetical protein
MKLRLLDDSIRLRLSRSEVAAADAEGTVEGRTRFPDGSAFAFALEALPVGEADAAFEAGRLVVRLAATRIAAWANDEQAVSLRAELELPDGRHLKVLVEKDFQCVTPRGDEDQSDLFPNPDSSQC